MKFTSKVKAATVFSLATLGALQFAHAQVDSTGISALRGTPRLEAAAPASNQGGLCGLATYTKVVTTGWSASTKETITDVTTCNGTPVRAPTCLQWTGPLSNRSCQQWSASCPSGYRFVSLGSTQSVSTFHQGGSGSTGSGSTESRTTTTTNATCVNF